MMFPAQLNVAVWRWLQWRLRQWQRHFCWQLQCRRSLAGGESNGDSCSGSYGSVGGSYGKRWQLQQWWQFWRKAGCSGGDRGGDRGGNGDSVELRYCAIVEVAMVDCGMKLRHDGVLASPQFVIWNNAPIGELAFCLTRQIYVKLAKIILYFPHDNKAWFCAPKLHYKLQSEAQLSLSLSLFHS